MSPNSERGMDLVKRECPESKITCKRKSKVNINIDTHIWVKKNGIKRREERFRKGREGERDGETESGEIVGEG